MPVVTVDHYQDASIAIEELESGDLLIEVRSRKRVSVKRGRSFMLRRISGGIDKREALDWAKDVIDHILEANP